MPGSCEGDIGALVGLLAAILEEIAEQCGGTLFEEAAIYEEGMVQAGIGGDVVEGTGVSGFGVRGGVDQAREPGGVGGAGAHGAGLERESGSGGMPGRA